MGDLSEEKRRAVAALIQQAPDSLLGSIELAFRATPGPKAQAVRDAVASALLDRQARAVAFGPVMPLFAHRRDGVRAPVFPKAAADALWTELKVRRADAVTILHKRLRERDASAAAVLLDGLCAEAAALLHEGDPGRWGVSGTAAESLAAFLQIAPIARTCLPRLHDWLGRLDAERTAALRLAFRDAAGVREDGGARLLELLMGQLDEAAQVLRLVAAVTDRADESFVRSTELADFGERLVEAMERKATRLEALGRAGGGEPLDMIDELEAAASIVAEFELSLPQASGGNWSRRLAAARSRITERLETQLRGLEKLVDKALPLTSVRLAGRMSRRAPDLTVDPRSSAVGAARAGLVLLAGLRGAASAFGCESLRHQVGEAVAVRLESHADEILQILHGGDAPDVGRAQALLETAADFLTLARGEGAGELVRRRAAVAAMTDARLTA